MNSIETSAFSLSSSGDYAAYIGIDWADRKHDICLYDPTTGTWEPSVIAHTPDAIKAWVESLRQRFNGQRIAIATELKRGPLIYVLCQFDFLVLYPVNPRTVANYRKAFKLSRAKSDPIDAQILVELLLKHDEKLRAWEPESSGLELYGNGQKRDECWLVRKFG
jgi:Transposase